VDAWYADLTAHEVAILDAPRNQDFGHRALFFRDPEGNVLEIFADISAS